MSQLENYKKERAILFNFKSKYENKIELDKTKRSLARIINFLKKKLFNNDIPNDIPGVYRYRCFVYDSDIIGALLISYNEQNIMIECEDNSEVRRVLRLSLMDELQNQLISLTETAKKIPIIFDLRTDPNMPIKIGANEYYLDPITINNIQNIYSKIDLSTINGERFHQMLEWSKALAQSYASISSTSETKK